MISVIVTTRNRPDFLYRCLLAIRNQTFRDFECIVVGDHCLFAQMVMVDFPEFRFINNTTIKIKNVGAVGKNIGIEAARNDRIAYCDDDNVWLPNHLQVMADNIEKHAFCFTKFYQLGFHFASALDILDRPIYDVGYRQLGNYDGLTLCHTKKVWEEAGKWQPWHLVGYNEDGDFIRRLRLASAKCKWIDEITAVYYLSEKFFTEYENELFTLAGTRNSVVYPQLIDEWKKEISRS